MRPDLPHRFHSAALAALLLGACSHPAIREAESLARNNQIVEADRLLSAAVQEAPRDQQLRAVQLRMHEQAQARMIARLEGLRQAGRWDEASEALSQLQAMAPKHSRLTWYQDELAKGQRHEASLQEARRLLKDGQVDAAETIARSIASDTPQHAGARLLLTQVAQARPLDWASPELGPAYRKLVNLDFREAPLQQVFAALAQTSGINFVFDKEVRNDLPVTVSLRQVSLDDAMRVVLAVHQLERKLLSSNAVLIYPATQAKQREHQELVTRTLYLTHVEVKQAQNLVRNIAKVRDLYIDERLNLLVIRETPEVVRLVERLIASVDLPEPEVMLEVEVMELSSDRLNELGLQWPEAVQYGLPGVAGQVEWSLRDGFRASIANPVAVAKLKGNADNVNVLANPKIRVRSREKAKIHIGQRVPVFTTTSTANVGVSASVSYLDVGLKLDVEPTVQLDNDVIIKVGLEVSNLLGQVTGPAGSTAYQIGTRQSQTTLKLVDGETQVLAGLINDEERRSVAGVPGLSTIPLLGALFGVQKDSRNKTEVVLLITPRVVRSMPVPPASVTRLPGGTEASPGAFSSRLESRSAEPTAVR